MRKLSCISILLLLLSPVILLNSCEKKEDYSHIIYKNYLTWEINSATSLLRNVVEGSKEGEYKPGSKQTYQDVVDYAKVVDENASSTQEEIDVTYATLLQANEEFFDQMVPFRSSFQELIDYAEVTLASTEEGDQEGNVNPGNKEILQDAIDDAKYTISRVDLTQRMLDQATTDLLDAILLFNSEINGMASIQVTNPGFEMPGYETTSFGEVDGWNVFGKAEDWAPLASISGHETAPEGEFVAKIGSYTQGIYQNIFELIQPNAQYTFTAEISLLSNDPDWEGKKYPAILLSRLIVFEQEVGDYNFITVISDSYDTLGIDSGGFMKLNHSVSIDAVSNVIGKKVAIDFVQRHTWNAEEPIWAESFVAIDDIRLYRQL